MSQVKSWEMLNEVDKQVIVLNTKQVWDAVKSDPLHKRATGVHELSNDSHKNGYMEAEYSERY